MLFHHTGHVPANTTKQNPFWEKLKIRQGTITEWILFQSDECADQLKFRVVYHGSQILPFNPDSWAYGFFSPTKIGENIEIKDSPFTLDLYAVNSDDSYEHEYHVYVSVIPEKPVVPGAPSSTILERFRSMLGG